jgi:hypothetical protein
MKILSGDSAELGMALFGAVACLACGCATTEDIRYGVPLDAANRPQAAAAPPPLVVRASEAPTYSTSYLGLVEVTFENHTGVWKQVDRVALDFGSPAKNQTVTIASADDIDAWERAIALLLGQGNPAMTAMRTAIEGLGAGPADRLTAWLGQRERAAVPAGAAGAPVAAGATPVAAGATPVAAGATPVAAGATPVAAGAAPVAAGAATITVPATPSYPEQHLLTTPFRVPPGLFTKRWILLSTPDNPPGGCVDSMILSYETSDHASGRVLLPFKVNGTDWQAGACYQPDVPPSASSNR